MSVKCFICDSLIINDKNYLASFKLKHSKKQIYEQLGTLIGEKFVIVFQDSDAICQNCILVLESIDKLEDELVPLKKLILNFLEKKYLLENDKLPDGSFNNETEIELGEKHPLSFGVRRRKGTVPALTGYNNHTYLDVVYESFDPKERKRQASESIDKLNEEISEDPRSKILLECDTCHYTTNYPTFVDRHVKKATIIPVHHNGLNSTQILKVEDITEENTKTEVSLDSPSLLHDLLEKNCLEPGTELSCDADVTDLSDNEKTAGESLSCYQPSEGSNSENDETQQVFRVTETGGVGNIHVVWDAENDY